jgi:hypothetical protein
MREYRYTVDRDGRIAFEGSEITDPAVLRFFLLAMQRAPDGAWVAMCQGERNTFDAADTPFVVLRVRSNSDDSLELYFAGDYHERLDPATLENDDGQLVCRVRRGAFRARFGRQALQQLGGRLEEDSEGLALTLGETRHPVRAATA